ncbi:MAG: pyruvate kinase, partial [Gammaproteobacteria bacterium]|nr:pyruvate kinase [Gammaproteobacteria bacterium]
KDLLLLDDGQIVLEVERIDGTRIVCTVAVGGELGDNKGINRQGGGLSAPALTDKDREDLRQAAELDMDWIAISFVRTVHDLRDARGILREAGGNAKIIAKIERAEA